MEFKTIVYIIAGAIWLLSRFFQKREQDENRGRGAGIPAPSGESSPQPVRQAKTRQMPQKKPMVSQRHDRPSQELLPSPVSLEVPLSNPLAKAPVAQSVSNQEPSTVTAAPSDAELIADEIRNGHIDWRRSLIISELLGKRHGF